MRLKLSALACVLLIGCSGAPDLDDPKLSTRELNLEEFFEGKTVAHGQFQDLFGNVKRRFEVDITGTWDGQTLTLVEDFTYADGSTEQRIWTLNKTGKETWSGTAPGVIGTAQGEERGDTFNWTYRIDLPGRDGDTTRVDFDDWMWLLTEGRILNRAYVKKFGVTVGEAIIVFEKS
ncbi:DUF3833 domain-containing protein [Aliiroseovarius sediminis]|uniref:DUF3833 domain-containing protein n=1 Tax=Aliiroseovarius sediminis TaxID=2925839 RepID=UPI001F5819A5|nr:DUF3833 domain-containing protein [Aliiroseovarius sediminis]MCI2395647.1 DUF3833 domain-containing protein [Aliiroseovarius sediminis]